MTKSRMLDEPRNVIVYLTFPCCKAKSHRVVKATGPCSKNFSLVHNKCSHQWNISVTVKWDKTQSKLRTAVKWIQEDPDAAFVKNFPKLRLGETPTIKPKGGKV